MSPVSVVVVVLAIAIGATASPVGEKTSSALQFTASSPDGYQMASAGEQKATAASANELTILSLNLACRDVAQLSGCDNCQTRFDLIASAIRGEAGFAGVPDLSNVDVVVAQELGTAQANFAQVTAALAQQGFKHTTGAPAPTASDPKCTNPPGPLPSADWIEFVSALSGLESGGLVLWSKHPILATVPHQWCAQNLPAPAGYLSALLDVNGVATLVIDVHLFPEFKFGIDAAEVRTYQFSELSAFAKAAEAALREAGVPFAVVLGGDFNEDMYGLTSKQSTGNQCTSVADRSTNKLASVNLDLHAACAAGAIGAPTWDPTKNDLTAIFSSSGIHEALDYLILHSSSAPASAAPAPNNVATLKTDAAWAGTFCESAMQGTLGGTFKRSVNALTDHERITATFALPASPADKEAATSTAKVAFASMVDSWTTEVQAAACGQSGSQCAFDSNCCNEQYSWTSVEQRCDGITCAACQPLNASCAWGVEGTVCCGYEDYTETNGTPNGAHCELESKFNPSSGRCIHKYAKGRYCLHDEECQSRDCSFSWKGWRYARYCQ